MGIFNFSKKPKDIPDWFTTLPRELANAMLNEIKTNPQVCSLDEIPEGQGRFGLDPSNPVPVYGVPENEAYLKRLSIKGGGTMRWRRVGSMSDSIIERQIDEYEIFDSNGDTIAFIYVSPYHMKTSNKAPEGFRII